MDLHLRRVRRTDLGGIARLLESSQLPMPQANRASLRRFRSIVADLGCDFDVATCREQVRGFVHLLYARDLLAGNRAHMLALVGDSSEVRAALAAAAIDRATRRHSQDITVSPGPWMDAIGVEGLALSGWETVDGSLRIDLVRERGQCDTHQLTPAREPRSGG